MMNKYVVAATGIAGLMAVTLLTGCDSQGNLTPNAQAVVNKICPEDEALQPAVVVAASAAGPAGMAAAGVDSAVVHPVVVAVCAASVKPPVAK